MLHVSFKCIRVHVFRGCCTVLFVTVKIQGRLQLLYLLYHKQSKNFKLNHHADVLYLYNA
jgi:hypothetical protein